MKVKYSDASTTMPSSAGDFSDARGISIFLAYYPETPSLTRPDPFKLWLHGEDIEVKTMACYSYVIIIPL